MAQDKSGWMQWLEIVTNILTAAGSVVIPVLLFWYGQQFADQQSKESDAQHLIDQQDAERSLVIATAGYLSDPNASKQQAGLIIFQWLEDQKIAVPQPLVVMVTTLSQKLPTPNQQSPTVTNALVPLAAPASDTQQVSQTASNLLSGIVPHLFIQIATEDQRISAQQLREKLQQVTLGQGQPVIVPGIERVDHPPSEIELRYLKKNDAQEASTLSGTLAAMLQGSIKVEDLSAVYDSRKNVKPLTFELWFPPGPIVLKTNP